VPATVYLALCAPFLATLYFAPEWSVELVLGRLSRLQSDLLPTLAAACTLAGVFLILAQEQLRLGRFAFLAFAGGIVAIELSILAFVGPSAVTFARVVVATNILVVVTLLLTPTALRLLRPFKGSATYWQERYARGGTSGAGSQGKFAEFKAEVLNGFVLENRVGSVIELGCGDGTQLALARYPHYIGYDVSAEAIELCRDRFAGDSSKEFRAMNEYSGEQAELALSLDVVYHLVEDEVFDGYMRRLFDVSSRWVIVYSSNTEANQSDEASHVRHRLFTRWVSENRPDWVLRERIPNRFPFDGDPRLGSFSDFFIFERPVATGDGSA
jgi:SAM-dependent methyltransferase